MVGWSASDVESNVPLRLLAHLGNSEAAARTIGDIAESARVSRREVEASIQQARLDGYPVVSSAHGVWLGTDQEALAWCERQRSRAIHLMQSAQGVQRGVERRQSPLTLWEAA